MRIPLTRIGCIVAVGLSLVLGCASDQGGARQPATAQPGGNLRGDAGPEDVSITPPPGAPAPVEWAAEELAKAVRARGRTAEVWFHHSLPGSAVGSATPASNPSCGEVHIKLRGFYPQNTAGKGQFAAESYALGTTECDVVARYADEVGGMYALLDLAERVRLNGLDALRITEDEIHKPTVAFRGVNPFLSIPLADKDGKRDWEHWWFTDEEYWRGYLDLLAKAHINWIDMHGMYDIQVTSFPNMWPYFVVSEKYPDVGMPPEQARKNLTMLQKVCHMAKERGIRLGIMNYTGGWNWPGCRPAPERPVADFIEYTKEGLKQIVKGCPDLGMIGFRIGESGYGEDFYAKSYVAALEELGRPLPLYTRTWGAAKPKLMELGKMYPDKFIIEIKYNGEQMGPPWHVAGGRMAGWRDYSYQDYLFYPRAYKVIWQIRANGTHRIFQWAGFEHIRECVKTTNLAGSVGFCVEPMSTYYPVTDFFHKKPLFRWEYERNPLWYLMWGRLAYDPNTPEDVFRLAAREHWGTEYGDKAYELLQSMSRIVPTIKTQFSLGPDHRDHAPELEWGGSIRQWAKSQPFDTFSRSGPADYAREVMTGAHSGRLSPTDTAFVLELLSAETEDLSNRIPAKTSSALDDLILDAHMLAALSRYYMARLTAAAAFAMVDGSAAAGRRENLPELVEELPELVAESATQWKNLAELGDTNYRPFIDTLRMHTQTYLWSQSTARFERDRRDLETMLVSDVPLYVSRKTPSGASGDLKLRIWADQLNSQQSKQALVLRAAVGGLAGSEKLRTVNLLWKPFRSESQWQRIPMQPAAGQPTAGSGVQSEWTAQVEITAEGAMYGLEVITDQQATIARVDGVRPYGVIDPWPVP
jgi:hypothetical protein